MRNKTPLYKSDITVGVEESSSYQELLDKAREISRARYAAFVKLDRKTLQARVVYFSGANTQAFLKGTSAIQKSHLTLRF